MNATAMKNAKITVYGQNSKPALKPNMSYFSSSHSMIMEPPRLLNHDTSAVSSTSSIPKNHSMNKNLAQHHRTAAANQFQYNSHLKRHSLQRILIEQDGTSSITKFMSKADMKKLIDHEAAGAYDPFYSGE